LCDRENDGGEKSTANVSKLPEKILVICQWSVVFLCTTVNKKNLPLVGC